MWEYVRLEDDTQVSYSEVREDNTVKVVVERPRDWGLTRRSVSCRHSIGCHTRALAKRTSKNSMISCATMPHSSCVLPTKADESMPSLFRLGHISLSFVRAHLYFGHV